MLALATACLAANLPLDVELPQGTRDVIYLDISIFWLSLTWSLFKVDWYWLMPLNCLTLNFLQGPPAYVSSRVKRDTPGYAPPGSLALINFILWPLVEFVWTSLWLIIMISFYHDFDPSYDFCSPSLPRSQGPSRPRLHFCQNRSQGDEFVFVVVGIEWFRTSLVLCSQIIIMPLVYIQRNYWKGLH